MAQFNKLILQANLGSDPQVDKSAGGKLFARVSLANSQGSEEFKNEHTNWIDGVAFNRMVGVVSGFSKGAHVLVTGKIETRSIPLKNPATGEVILNPQTGNAYTQRKTSFIILSMEAYTGRKQVADAQAGQAQAKTETPGATEETHAPPPADVDADELDAITF